MKKTNKKVCSRLKETREIRKYMRQIFFVLKKIEKEKAKLEIDRQGAFWT